MIKNLLCVSCGSLKQFPHTFTTVRRSLWDGLCGAVSVGQSVWASLCRTISVGQTLQDCLFGTVSVGQSLQDSLFGKSLWNGFCGTISVEQSLWDSLCGTVSVGQSLRDSPLDSLSDSLWDSWDSLQDSNLEFQNSLYTFKSSICLKWPEQVKYNQRQTNYVKNQKSFFRVPFHEKST